MYRTKVCAIYLGANQIRRVPASFHFHEWLFFCPLRLLNRQWFVNVAMSMRKRGQANGHSNGRLNGSISKPARIEDPKTDYSRWRLRDDRGIQTWHYLQTDEEMRAWPQTVADRHFMGLDTVSTALPVRLSRLQCVRADASLIW